MAQNGTVGSKRPFQGDNSASQRKRPAADGEDDLIDEVFDMGGLDEDGEDLVEEVEEVEEGALGEAGKNWQRPPPAAIDTTKERLVFQQLEVDNYSGSPNQTFYKTDLKEAPVLRMYGVNELGKSSAATTPLDPCSNSSRRACTCKCSSSLLLLNGGHVLHPARSPSPCRK